MLGSLFPTRKNPHIPGRDSKDRLTTDFSGTRFSIDVPPTSNGFASTTDKHKEKLDICDPTIFEDQAVWDYMKGCPSLCSFLVREPTLFGGLLASARLGQITIVGSVHHFYDLPKNMSLFNPAHCEQAIRRLTYFYHGPGSLKGKLDSHPLNWQVLEQCGHQWAYFEALSWDLDESETKVPESEIPSWVASPYCTYSVPLSSNSLLTLNFHFMGYRPVKQALKNLYALREEIFKTVSLEYSERALEEKLEAKQRWPEAKFSQVRAKEQWEMHEFINEIDYKIRECGSPPPAWKP